MRLRRLLGAAAILALAVVPARAQEAADPHLHATFDAISPPLTGVMVALHEAPPAAPEIDLTNTSGTPLVVLGFDGEPFVRIGPDGVAGNLRSRTFFTTQDPSGTSPVPPSVQANAAPVWRKVAAEPRWRWWERRAQWRSVLPAGIASSTQPVTLGPWNVPARYGNTLVRLTGTLLWKPFLGVFRARLTSPSPAGVTIAMLQGPVPGLIITNRSGAALEVQGRDGSAFARVGAGGVEVNLASATAHDTPRFLALGTSGWKHVQDAPVLSWLERRARYDGASPVAPQALRRTTFLRWSVPAKLGDRSVEISGVTEWVPSGSTTPVHRGTPRVAVLGLGAGVVALVGAVLWRIRKAH